MGEVMGAMDFYDTQEKTTCYERPAVNMQVFHTLVYNSRMSLVIN